MRLKYLLLICMLSLWGLFLSACVESIPQKAPPGGIPTLTKPLPKRLPTPTPTKPPDTDHDTIPDWIEDWVAQNFAPYFIYDEQELADEVRYVYQVTPVLLNGQPHVLFIVVALYDMDWAEVNEALGIDVKWHYGDTESIRLYLSYNSKYPNDPYRRFEGDYRVAMIHIRRHYKGFDYSGDAFEYLQGTHPIVWVSEGKHGMYASSDECHDNEFFPGFDEHCNGGPEWYANLPFALNVGERDHPYFRYTDERQELRVFPGERIWDNNYPFCGGYDVGDERWEYWDVPPFGKWPECAGSVGGKWFPWK